MKLAGNVVELLEMLTRGLETQNRETQTKYKSLVQITYLTPHLFPSSYWLTAASVTTAAISFFCMDKEFGLLRFIICYFILGSCVLFLGPDHMVKKITQLFSILLNCSVFISWALGPLGVLLLFSLGVLQAGNAWYTSFWLKLAGQWGSR